MKKNIIIISVVILISFIFGTYIVLAYKNSIIKNIEPVEVYMMLYKSYNDKKNADKLDLDNYILTYENGFYKVYVGSTLKLDNANKIKDIYLDNNDNVFIIKKELTCSKFTNYLKENDSFDNLSDNDILLLQNDIVNKYKEVCL